MDIVLVVRKHPDVRQQRLHRGLFWKATQPVTLLALVGAAASLTVARRRPTGAAAVLMTSSLPWLRARRGIPTSALAGTFLLDAVEVVAMVRGSLRHRALVL